MARTINRMPNQVSIPGNNDFKSYSFNHIRWKGLSNNKNVLDVDQETFEDCNNVYVDTSNILVSRPPVTKYNIPGVNNISNIWTFADVIALHVRTVSGNKIMFFKDDIFYNEIICGEYIKLVFVEGKIFVFSEISFGFFDTDLLTHANMFYDNGIKNIQGLDPEPYIYIPNTVISTNSIQGDNESPNELTTGQTITYNYSTLTRIDFNELIGRTVILTIAGKKYVIDNFVTNNEKVIVQPFAVSVVDTIVSSVEKGTFIGYDKSRNIIYYSANGVIWDALPIISGIVGNPHITNDGASCVVFKSDGFYMYSLAVGVDNKYPFVDDTDVRIWKKFDYGFISGELLDTNFVPAAEFDTNDLYAFVVRSTIKTYFKLSNPDMSNAGATSMPYEITALNIVEVGHITFTRFAAVGTKLAISYLTGTQDIYGHYTFAISVYDISSAGIVTHPGTSILRYNGQSLVNVNLNIPVKNTDLKIIWNVSELDYAILSAGGVGTDVSAADVYWLSSVIDDVIVSFTEATIIVEDLPLREPSTYYLISNRDNSILTERYLYLYNETQILPLLSFNIGAKPIVNDSYLINSIGKQLYSTDVTVNIPIQTTLTESIVNFKQFYSYAELSHHYLSSGNYLYISQDKRNENNEFLWYLPTINTQQFNYEIFGLHVLSTEDVAIFFKDEVWYVTPVSINDIIGYKYTKSKLQIGISKGSDIITSFDGKYVIFATERGLAAMSYQDFVASTEQTLEYLSDLIPITWQLFAKQSVKLFNYLYWIACYVENLNVVLIYDIRTSSWWPWEYKTNIKKVLKISDNIVVLSADKLHKLGQSTKYLDDDDKIKWHIVSQLLHLKAINNYKHIENITLNTVAEYDVPFTCELQIINYRNKSTVEKPVVLEYEVDIARTFIKRLNFSKVIQFQYILNNDNNNTQQLPLSLTSIIVKYGVKERIR